MTSQADEDERLRVFLSYSRVDRAFVEQLASSLESCGYQPDFDLYPAEGMDLGISAEDEWWVRLQEMIASSQVVILVLSPDAVRSRVCDEEIAFARALGKRIVPVLRRAIDFISAPPRVAALNVKIDFSTDEEFEGSLQRLANALDRDVLWLRNFSRLTMSALRWQAAGQSTDHLLHGVEIAQADELVARRPASEPELSDLVLSYLLESRKNEAGRRVISQVQRARYLELVRIVRPFLDEELRIRESLPTPSHYGVAQEMKGELELVRSMLELNNRWHPEEALFVTSTGATEGYAQIFRFPCCSRIAKDFLSSGEGDPPSQFRSDGCEEVPASVQHAYRERTNRFLPQLVIRHRRFESSPPDCPVPGRDVDEPVDEPTSRRPD